MRKNTFEIIPILLKPVNTAKRKSSLTCKTRKGVSEVIATLLMVSITVVGAVLLSSFFYTSGIAQSIGGGFGSTAFQTQQSPSLKLTAYDTRDHTRLLDIQNLDNYKNDKKLCTKTCATAPDSLPSQTGGTEFIVLQIKNEGINSVLVRDVIINGIDHIWDNTLSGNLDTTATPPKIPKAGKFVIIMVGSNVILTSNELANADEVKLVIKLSKDLVIKTGSPPVDSDISLNLPLVIKIDTGSAIDPTFVVTSGDIM